MEEKSFPARGNEERQEAQKFPTASYESGWSWKVISAVGVVEEEFGQASRDFVMEGVEYHT